MKKKHSKRLHNIFNQLTNIEHELEGYGALLCSMNEHDYLEGRVLYGPGQRLKANAQKIQTICKNLDSMLVQIHKEKKQ